MDSEFIILAIVEVIALIICMAAFGPMGFFAWIIGNGAFWLS